MKKLALIVICTSVMVSCSVSYQNENHSNKNENQYSVTYNTDPEGAQLYCDDAAQGYTPVTLYYTLNEEIKESGILLTNPCYVRWSSGLTGEMNTEFDLNEFPDGVIITSTRPVSDGYTQDVEFALKVKTMKATQDAAKVTKKSGGGGYFQNSEGGGIFKKSVDCTRLGGFGINAEIKTFSGMFCPFGWVKAY